MRALGTSPRTPIGILQRANGIFAPCLGATIGAARAGLSDLGVYGSDRILDRPHAPALAKIPIKIALPVAAGAGLATQPPATPLNEKLGRCGSHLQRGTRRGALFVSFATQGTTCPTRWPWRGARASLISPCVAIGEALVWSWRLTLGLVRILRDPTPPSM